MDSLLGFIVLSGPVFLILIFVLVSVVGVIILRKKITGRLRRFIGGLSVFGVAFFILFGDELLGKKYLEYLCENNSDINVLGTVELSSKYWNKDGSPRFINAKGQMTSKELGERFQWKIESKPYFKIFIKIDERKWIYVDKVTNKKLGNKTTFTRYYGWLNNFSTAPNVSESCRNALIRKNRRG